MTMQSEPISILQLSTADSCFDDRLTELLAWENVSDQKVEQIVGDILAAVRQRGDQALIEFTNRFDARDVGDVRELEIPPDVVSEALAGLPAAERDALELAAERIRRYHQHQKQASWHYREEDGTLLGQQITALDRVGIYVPGGKASYPSSVDRKSVV